MLFRSTLGVALIYFAIMFAVAELLPRLLHADREDYGAYQVMTLFSNIGFMGYPLLDVMYGSNAIIHAVIFNLLYNVLIYTYGIHKMQIGGCQKNINLLYNIFLLLTSKILTMAFLDKKRRSPFVTLDFFFLNLQ